MPKELLDFGLQFGQQVAGTGLGLLLQKGQDKRQIRQQQQLTDMQLAAMKDMGKFNLDRQMELWEKTNYPAQMEMLKQAGLNPGLLYGMGGAGGATAAATPGSAGGATAAGHSGEAIAMGQTAAQLGLMRAQKENIEADTQLKQADAEKRRGVDTEKTKAETTFIKLNTSWYKETFDTRIEQLNREIELSKQKAREIDQQVGITEQTREANVNKAIAESFGAVLENLLIGEKINATQQEITESKERVNQMSAQINKWSEEIKQNWYSLSLKEKELKLDAIMKEVEVVTSKRGIHEIPSLNMKQRKQVIKQIDKIASISPENY